MNFFEGKLSAKGLKVAIVAAKFNSFIGDKLISGAENAFVQLEGDTVNLDVFKVPGSCCPLQSN